MENPTGTRDVTNSSIRGLLARNLGYYIVASFLMGTQQAIQCEGILASVGNDYLVIYQPDQNRFVSGDIYALKFVEFHEGQSAWRQLPPPGCLPELVKKALKAPWAL